MHPVAHSRFWSGHFTFAFCTIWSSKTYLQIGDISSCNKHRKSLQKGSWLVQKWTLKSPQFTLDLKITLIYFSIFKKVYSFLCIVKKSSTSHTNQFKIQFSKFEFHLGKEWRASCQFKLNFFLPVARAWSCPRAWSSWGRTASRASPWLAAPRRSRTRPARDCSRWVPWLEREKNVKKKIRKRLCVVDLETGWCG